MTFSRPQIVHRGTPVPPLKSTRISLAPERPLRSEPVTRDIFSYSPRERILAAALKLFVEQGYFNTNIPDLSKESKCSVGSIYHTFKNKEEVASALFDEGVSALRTTLARSLRDDMDVAEVVHAVVGALLRFCELNQQLSRYVWLCRHNEFMNRKITHPTRLGFDPLGRKLAKSIKKGMREGKIREMDPHVVWSVLFGVPVAYVRDWLEGYATVPPSDVAAEVATACWRALRA